jgi:hypothetical protein
VVEETDESILVGTAKNARAELVEHTSSLKEIVRGYKYEKSEHMILMNKLLDSFRQRRYIQ